MNTIMSLPENRLSGAVMCLWVCREQHWKIFRASTPTLRLSCSAGNFWTAMRHGTAGNLAIPLQLQKKVAKDGDKTQAAIASPYAAEYFGLVPLATGIYSNPGNSTRFIIVTKEKIYCKDAKKISVSYELPHESGSLYNSLSHFIYNGLNMTKIESRPIAERNWEYRFFVDFEGNLSDSAVQNALRGLKAEAQNLRVHGNY